MGSHRVVLSEQTLKKASVSATLSALSNLNEEAKKSDKKKKK
jgi:hypothetical protein